MSTPRHRADAVEESSRAPASARHDTPVSLTPIYDRLVWEVATGWPLREPVTDSLTVPTVQFDEWFKPWPEVVHNGPPTGGLFQQAVVAS